MAQAKTQADQSSGDQTPPEAPADAQETTDAASGAKTQADQPAESKRAATKRYKVIVTQLNRIVDGERRPVKFGKVLELDPESVEAKRLLGTRPPAIISLDDDGEDVQDDGGAEQRGTLDATPPGPPAPTVPIAGSQGAPVEADDKGAPLT